MILVGLTGGIGAGKSTVSALLAAKGAVVIDADAITHELQRAGTPVLEAIVERFGAGVLTGDGELDRPALAEIVFHDPDELAALNAIVHPAVGAEMAARLAAEADTDHVVVLDVPLLVESGRADMAGTVVVDVPPEVASFGEATAARHAPSPVFVLDVARAGGALRVVEYNCLHGAGFYASDVGAVVRALNDYVASTTS